MKKPDPEVGLVIRYDYLWRNEAIKGHQDGAKDRPCAIVVARHEHTGNETHVLLAPITHTKPEKSQVALPIPTKVARHLGLDSDQSWIKLDELNAARWGDPGIIPAQPGQKWEYGRLPNSLWQPAVEIVAEQARQRKVKIVDRIKAVKFKSSSHRQDEGNGR